MIQDLLNFLFPKICACCNRVLLKNEKVICTVCRHELPLTRFHLDNENETKKVFYGRVPIQNATSLLLFEKKGKTQQLMHNLKYRGHKAIGKELGRWVANNLLETTWHSEIDVVVPVPLHKKRLNERGYNQVEGFGKIIAETLQVPYNDRCLIKTHGSKTQVFKNLTARFKNVKHSFEIEEKETRPLENKHILLVDDIITTGATLETCAEKLIEITGVDVSLATMAKTR